MCLSTYQALVLISKIIPIFLLDTIVRPLAGSHEFDQDWAKSSKQSLATWSPTRTHLWTTRRLHLGLRKSGRRIDRVNHICSTR